MKYANLSSRLALVGAGVALVLGLAWFSGVAQLATAQGPGGVGATLRALFNQEPNMVPEDHTAISCVDTFTLKLFTARTLNDVRFVVTDTETNDVLLGPIFSTRVDPLWDSIQLGPLASIPPEIAITMTATDNEGNAVEDILILEPQCQDATSSTRIINNTTIINPNPPGGKTLFNPPLPPEEQVPLEVPVMAAVPPEALGETIVATLRFQDEDGVERFADAQQDTIETELVQLRLTGAVPFNQSVDSFFDVWIDIRVGDPEGPGIESALGEPLTPPAVGEDDRVVHPDGSASTFHVDSFFDVWVDVVPLRFIDATPLELRALPESPLLKETETTTSE